MTPVLLLHGFLGAPSTWDAVAARLSPAVGRIALPGHGPEPDPVPAGFIAAVDALAARLAAPAIVAGYSMGARLALGLALRHPSRVKAAVLVGVNPGIEDEAARRARRARDDAQAAAIEVLGLPAFVDVWERLPLFTTQRALPASLRAAERARRLSHHPPSVARAMRALGLGRQPPLWDTLAAARVPLLFLAGALDAPFVALARRAARIAPDAAWRAVPAAGHNLALEAPAEVAGAIAAHLDPAHEETNA